MRPAIIPFGIEATAAAGIPLTARVDATGTPAITMLNSDGEEVYRAVK
jgi:hypothetical protein